MPQVAKQMGRTAAFQRHDEGQHCANLTRSNVGFGRQVVMR